MTLEDKLRLHFADRAAAWREVPGGLEATWEGNLLRAAPGPLTAAAVVDAHAFSGAAVVTLAYEGAASPVAVRAAARFGIRLLDVATLPEPATANLPSPPVPGHLIAPDELRGSPANTRRHEDATTQHAPASSRPRVVVSSREPADRPSSPSPATSPAMVAPELPFPDPWEGCLDAIDLALVQQALEEAAREPLLAPSPEEVEADVEALVAALDAELAQPDPLVPVAEPASAPAPVSVTVPVALPAFPACEPALPWDPAVAVAADLGPEIVPTPHELLALPWQVGVKDDHAVMLAAGREVRGAPARPTLVPDWGLPWPRPVPPADGLAVADPALWKMHDRTLAMRDRLDAGGAASFGAVVPKPDPWLKKVQTPG